MNGNVTSREKQRVQRQFGDKAAAYASSKVHADPASLARLVDVVQPAGAWGALDVGTGAGHTAHTLAPHVRQVVASDLTPPMLAKTLELARERGLSNVLASAADAEDLPFADDVFDLVTSRLAAHHFPRIDRFLAEAARVLRPGGALLLVDNFVPGSLRSGKKERLQREAGRYLNAFDRLRDPSHQRCLSLYEWRQALYAAGFAIEHEEVARKELDFGAWTARMHVAPADVTRLRAMLLQAPKEVLEFLTPNLQGDTIKFYLSEALFVGTCESEH